MTYVILFDGFDTEGWESIQKLFEPSFADDGVKIYPSQYLSRAMEIDDIIDRNVQHTFIFLTVQKPRRKEKNDSLVEKYRYKTLLEKIRVEFPYCEHHQNILCVIDRIPKNIGSGLYIDREKETALALDKFGYLDAHKEHAHFFTIDDVYKIKKEIFELIHTAEKVTEELFGQEIEKIIHDETERKINVLQENIETSTCITRLKSMQEAFLSAFWQLELTSYEKRENLIENTLKRIFGETIGIMDSLRHISILTYRPEKIHEEDSETHITIASLISLIANRSENVMSKGWFEVSKLETDKGYLGRSLEHLSSVRLPELPDEKIIVNIHNIDQFNHTLEPFKDENIFSPIGNISWIYGKKREREIKNDIDNIWDKMDQEFDLLLENLTISKNDIYEHPGAKTDKEFTYQEVKEEAHKAVNTNNPKSYDTKDQIQDMLKKVSKTTTKGKFANYFEKLPSAGIYFLSLITFFMIVFLVSLIPVELWSKKLPLFLIDSAIFVILFLISFIPIWYFRKKIIVFLLDYLNKIKEIQREAHTWHDECIEEYKYSYETKLKYENRIFFRKKLKEIEDIKKKWKLHNNRVNELNKIANDLAARLDLSIDTKEVFLPLSIIEQDVSHVNDYALFTEKKHVEELVTDRTMSNKDMYCYGIIKMIEIKRIENGV